MLWQYALADEIGDDHLRETIADILAHGWNADIEEVFQLLPRHRTEIMQGEAWDVYLEMDDGKHQHGYGTTGSRGNGSPLDAQLWKSPVSEDEGVVA